MYPRQLHTDVLHGRIEQAVFTGIGIVGAAFIAVVGASGGAALIFVPVVLVASAGSPSGSEHMPETP